MPYVNSFPSQISGRAYILMFSSNSELAEQLPLSQLP
jgi:hypothetical protein